MIAAHPGQGLRKMLYCNPILFEDYLEPPGRAVESDAVRKLGESALIGLQRNQQFTITLLVSGKDEEVVGTESRFRRAFLGQLLACLNVFSTGKVVLAFGVLQDNFTQFVPQLDRVGCT